MKPNKEEKELIGAWEFIDGKVIENAVSQRIHWLINNYLIKIKTDVSGWNVLYNDPEDGRYWELDYPRSDLQGGGPPSLINVTYNDVKDKYNL